MMQKIILKYKILFLLTLCLTHLGTYLIAYGQYPVVPSNELIENQLKLAVLDSQKKIPDLKDLRKILFDDEVVPQYRRFIRNDQRTVEGLKAEVDFDAIHHFLSFQAPLFKEKALSPFLLAIKLNGNCLRCQESADSMGPFIQGKLEKRGFISQWLKPVEVKSLPLDSEEELTSLIQKKNAQGILIVNLFSSAQDELDTVGSFEDRYFIQLSVFFSNLFVQGQKKNFLAGKFPNEIQSSLFTDLIIDLGAKMVSRSSQLQGIKEELKVEISQFKDFMEYSHAKNQILSQLNEFGVAIEEREFSKGQVVLGIALKDNKEAVKTRLEAISFELTSNSRMKIEVRSF